MTQHTHNEIERPPQHGAPRSMRHVGFARFAAQDPGAAAVVDTDGTVWSRGELARLGRGIAHAFTQAGLARGDAVAVATPNCAEFLAAYMGAVQAGFDIVPLNWHLADDELRFILEDSGAKAVLAHGRLAPARLAALARHGARATLRVAIGRVPGFVPLETFVARHCRGPLEAGAAGRVIAYTSATAGRPKAVVLPRANARAALEKTVRWHISLGLEPGDRHVHLCTSMLYHSAPLEGCVTALHMGHRVVLASRPDPEHVLALVERHGVTTSFMVPTLFVRLLKLPAHVRARYSTSSLEFVIHAGAACPVETKRAMLEWWGPIIWESYGAAEGQGTIASPAEWMRYPGTVGRPIPGSRISIMNDLGEELAPGRVGTIYLKPHTGDRFEYKGDPGRTRASYRGDLITVGDVGYVNEDGYLFVCDRRSDLIISSGMNIYPAEIEHVLVQHTAVADCAVIGARHELLGEVPIGVVQPRPGIEPGPGLSAELSRYLAARLSPMKLPRRIDYVATIPRGPDGKLHRRQLRERTAPARGGTP